MSQEEKHLSVEQIECLIESQPGVLHSPAPSELLEEASRHLVMCEACQRLVSMQKGLDRSLQGLREESPGPASSECPPVAALYELAAGLLDGKESEKLMKHAVECGGCAPVLRQAVEDLMAEGTTQENVVLRSLETSQPKWQESFARQLAAVSMHPQRAADVPKERSFSKFFPSVRWVYGMVAAVTLCAITVGVIVWRSRPLYAERLLAEAYTERRTLEFRIPGARYGPVRVNRSSASNLDKPDSLLEAEALIGKEVARHPESSDWLQAKGRAELLDGNYDSAIRTLKQALELKPDAPSLLTDLASAYAQRAEGSGQPSDYGDAVEILGKALLQSPDDPVALYNRALAAERIFLHSEAIADWEHYLRVDPTGDWASDARRHLDALRERLKSHEGAAARPLLRPWEIVRTPATSSGELEDTIDARYEDYVSITMREWLPEGLGSPRHGASGKNETEAAVAFLARLGIEKHQDPWISDFLSFSFASFPKAVAALSKSIKASESGDYVVAQQWATQAESLFKGGGNEAGRLWAEFENVYALHLSHEGERCLQAVDSLAREISHRKYRLLEVQVGLEHAACLGTMGNYGQAQQELEKALELAKRSGYWSAYLRGLGFASDLASTIGDVRTGWSRAYAGLAKYWSGTYRPMLGYNLYTDFDTAAEARKQSHLQVAVWSEALALIASDQDPLLHAMAHSWMAKSANSAGMPELAEREFNEASRSFAAAPQNESNRNDRIEVETLLAQLEVRQGDRERASERLGRIAPGIPLLSNHYIAIRYYAVLGAVESGRGPANDGERSLRSAVALAERSLKSLRSDRDRSVWNEEVSEAYRNLVRARLDQGDYQTALEIWEWYRGAALRSGSRSVSTENTLPDTEAERNLSSSDLAEGPSLPILREVAQSLATLRSETVVSYGAFGDDFWIWTYDDRGVTAKKSSASSIQIESLANRFVELCSNPESNVSAVRRDARRLYELLVEPVKERLAGRLIIFEPDKSLARVPLEALIDRSDNYLLDFNPIVVSPGLYFRRVAHRDDELSPQAEALVLVVSAPRAPQAYGLLPLQDAEREGEMVARSFRSGRLLRGSEATFDAVKSLLPSVRIFHFAGHAISSRDAVGLVLADTDFDRNPKFLDAAFLEGEKLDKMQVAVLSACATESAGLETYVAADDLGMAFLRSGVPHVVGSRWNVDSAGSAFLMQQFYASLFSGKSVSESIRKAKMEVRLRPEWTHPYFWAPFEALGMP